MHSHGRTKALPAGPRLIIIQSALLLMAAALFALMPPADGPILLVPLHGQGALGMMGEDARLLGKGRFPGSVIISGRHPSFVSALLGQGVLILPALPLLCGSATIVES